MSVFGRWSAAIAVALVFGVLVTSAAAKPLEAIVVLDGKDLVGDPSVCRRDGAVCQCVKPHCTGDGCKKNCEPKDGGCACPFGGICAHCLPEAQPDVHGLQGPAHKHK